MAPLQQQASCILVLLIAFQTSVALRPCGDGAATASAVLQLQLQQDCLWHGSSASEVSGVLQQTRSGPPVVTAAQSGPGSGGLPHSAQLSYLVLEGFRLPDPSSPQGLIPAGLLAAPTAGHSSSLSLRDVRILVDGPTLQQHVGFFSKLPAVTAYTDGKSFLHVNFYAAGGVSWQSVGLLLADSVADARSTMVTAGATFPTGSSNTSSSRRGRVLAAAHSPLAAPGAAAAASSNSRLGRPKYNYVLAANDSNLAQHMQRLGVEDTPTPCLIYIDSNITFSKPPVPAAGIAVARPLSLVGLVGWNTSISWHMQVNQILLNFQWSNITFDSLALENFAPGDARSAELARPLSVSSANNFWPLFYNRSEDRLLIQNSTLVLGGQDELDYYLFWATVYHSKLPYFKTQARFIHDTIRIYTWKLGWQTDSAVLVKQSFSGSCRVVNSIYQLAPVVAPRMPRPQQLGPDVRLRPAERSQLVTAVGSPQAFKEQLAPLTGAEAGRPHVVLLRNNISMQPLFSMPGSANSTGSSSNSSNAAVEAAAFVPPGVPLAGIPVPAPLSIVGGLSSDADAESANTVLDLAFARGLLDATEDNSNQVQLQVQHVRLRGLAQGPGAAAATGLQSPDVWTLLGGAFRRAAADDVILSGCTLELPLPEFDRLKQLAQYGGGQVVLRLADDVRSSGGDGLVVLTGVTDQRPPSASSPAGGDSGRRLLAQYSASGSTLWVESLSAQGLSGSKLLLVSSDAATRMPGGYHWPGGALPVAAGGLSGAALAAAIAVPVVVCSVLAAAALYVVVRRRRQRRQQDAELGKDVAGSMPPASSRSSSYGTPQKVPDSSQRGVFAPAGSSNGHSADGAELKQQQQHMDAAAAGAPLRCSLDVAAGHDQALSTGWATKGSPPASGVKGSSSSPSSTTLDSAQSLSKVPISHTAASRQSPRTGAAAQTRQQQQQQQREDQQQLARGDAVDHPLGLSHRLTSAISHLQHDITRRRIMGPSEPGSRQPADRLGSSSGPSSPLEVCAASAAAAAGSRGASSSGAGQGSGDQDGDGRQQQAGGGSGRQVCSLVASRSPSMADSAAAIVGGAAPAELQLLALIGRGSFASVFRAIWRGRCVALKIVQLPACAGGDDELGLESRERMAVMEAVVSVTMSHPNIVQVYTFALQPLFQGDAPARAASQGVCQQQQLLLLQQQLKQQQAQHVQETPVIGFELQLVMEMCEEGSLRAALNQQRLVDPASPYRLPAVHLVLALAHDVACAMLHLHSEQIVHSDLKASNVLLTKANTFAPFTAALGDAALVGSGSGSGGQARPGSCAALLAAAQAAAGGRLVAKVADFGLSLCLDPSTTHVSHMHAGTLTHMSPELLLHARASKASDVYAFGILLWELVTGLRAFQGMPVALVGHNVTQLGLRPPWVPGVAPAVKQLVEDCWAQDPADRPSFAEILPGLELMLQQSPEQLLPGSPAAYAARTLQQQQQVADEQQQVPDTQQEQQGQHDQQQSGATAGGVSRPTGPACAAAEAAADVTGDWTM